MDNVAGVQEMVGFLLSRERFEPVVGIALAEDSEEMLLSVGEVRGVVGERVRVYCVASEFCLEQLRERLGDLALLAGAVRIWWPGVALHSDAGDHPLIRALDGDRGLVGEFARVFRLSQPDVRREFAQSDEVRRLAEREVTLAHERVEAEQQRIQAAEERVRDAHRERHEIVLRAEGAERRAAALELRLRSLDELPLELRLHVLIHGQWRRALAEPTRASHPLRYAFYPGFVGAVQATAGVRVEGLAWVLAVLACGYEPLIKALAPGPLTTGALDGVQRERPDGAKGWRCQTTKTSDTPTQLIYWVLADGSVEFDSYGEPRPA